MLDKAKDYLQKHLLRGGPYLLGLSGGPDSMALFYLLLEAKVDFHVVHIDHNCRVESAKEAALLQKLIADLGIPFHLIKLEKTDLSRPNLEDFLRTARYQGFEAVYKQIGARGLVLGHQRDDQIETVLKRVLEGSSLSKIKGISSVAKMQNMLIVRPLIQNSKAEILSHLKELGVLFFQDETNEDERFLRSRMRKKILPELEKSFGKGILANLELLGMRSSELDSYLNRQVQAYLDRVISGPFGDFLEGPFPKEKIELEYLISHLSSRSLSVLSRDEVGRISQYIYENRFGKKIVRPDGIIYFDRNGLFFVKSTGSPLITDYKGGGWRAYWLEALGSRQNKTPGLCLRYPQSGERLPNGVSLRRWYANRHVPAFMRNWPAVVYKDNQVVGECLTGFDWGI